MVRPERLGLAPIILLIHPPCRYLILTTAKMLHADLPYSNLPAERQHQLRRYESAREQRHDRGSMPHLDPDHLSWLFILIPAIIIAGVLKLDNRYCGPYFAIADVILSDFGSGYKWNDQEILRSLLRRFAYVVIAGVILSISQYRLPDIAAVFLVAGFLLIWPAFGHPLPVYARKSDWQVLLVWGLYVLAIVAFGMFGANASAFIQAVTGESASEFIRQDIFGSVFWVALGSLATAFRVPLQQSLWQRTRRRYSGGQDTIENG